MFSSSDFICSNIHIMTDGDSFPSPSYGVEVLPYRLQPQAVPSPDSLHLHILTGEECY